MKKEEALQLLYNAARLAPLNAEQHEAVRKAAETLNEELNPKEKKKE